MSNELVSVVMATYKSRQYLNLSIKSVLEQSYGDFELIVVDDNSQDEETLSLLHDFAATDPRIRLFFNSKNVGVSLSRNFGVEQAKGKYVTFTDHDDNYCPDFLERMVLNAEANQLPFTLCNVGVYKEENTQSNLVETGNYIPQRWFNLAHKGALDSFILDREVFLKDLSYIFMPVIPYCKLIDLSLYRKANLSFKDIYGYEDSDWCLRLMNVFPQYGLLDFVGGYHLIADSSVSHFVNDKLIQGMCDCIQARFQVLKEYQQFGHLAKYHLLHSLGLIMSRASPIEDSTLKNKVKNRGFDVLIKQGYSIEHILKALRSTSLHK